MVDCAYYKQVYLGSAIPEAAADEFLHRAAEALARLRRYYTVEGTQESEKMALCAIAEQIYASTGRRGGVSAATVGSVSVRYQQVDRAIYDCAATYLNIYRGVRA